jgi:hypothetical protein
MAFRRTERETSEACLDMCPLVQLRSALGKLQAYLRANASSLVDCARRYLLRPAHFHGGGQIDGQPGNRPAQGQETTDALEPTRRPPARSNSGWPCAGGRLPHLFQRWYPRFKPAGPPRGLFHCRLRGN